MSRSKWKGSFIDKSILKLEKKSLSYIKIRSRSSVIPEFLVGKTVHVYNGKDYKKLQVTRECVGYKFGDFSFTRKFTSKRLNKKDVKSKNKSKKGK